MRGGVIIQVKGDVGKAEWKVGWDAGEVRARGAGLAGKEVK